MCMHPIRLLAFFSFFFSFLFFFFIYFSTIDQEISVTEGIDKICKNIKMDLQIDQILSKLCHFQYAI